MEQYLLGKMSVTSFKIVPHEEFLSDLLKDDNKLLYYKHLVLLMYASFQQPSRVKKYTWLLTRRFNLILTQFHQQNR